MNDNNDEESSPREQSEGISLIKQTAKAPRVHPHDTIEDIDTIKITIGDSATRTSLRQIAHRTSGSQTNLVVRPDGNIQIERRSSSAGDFAIALKKRTSNATLPSVLDLLPQISTPAIQPDVPMLGASDTLERTGGTGK